MSFVEQILDFPKDAACNCYQKSDKLNVYSNNVEWSGKLIEYDIEFFFSIGEENGIYVNGEMMKMDDKFIDFVTKLKSFYEKFKSKIRFIGPSALQFF